MSNFIEYIIKNKLFFFFILSQYLIKSTNSICNTMNCPPFHGLCSGDICLCEENYRTVNNNQIQNNGIFCNYRLKSRYTAFLLEFFFPFGLGHFYAGKTYLSAIKLGLFILLVCGCCGVICLNAKRQITFCSVVTCLIVVLSLLGIVVMEIFDLVSYGFGLYKDGNGIEMN